MSLPKRVPVRFAIVWAVIATAITFGVPQVVSAVWP